MYELHPSYEVHEWHGYSSTDSLFPSCQVCNPRWYDKDEIALSPDHDIDPPVDSTTAINYELAGRVDSAHSFRDFRSPAKARRRHRERNEKYYSWRTVKPGQLGRPHHTPNHERKMWYTTTLSEAPVETMTKEDHYREAQMYPRPPKLHRAQRWETRPGGNGNRRGSPKHAHESLQRRIEEDLEIDVCTITGDFKGLDGEELFWTMVPFGLTNRAAGVLGDEGCERACYTCHRECREQQRREWEAAQFADEHDEDELAVDEEEWEMLSRASTASAQSTSCWDIADAGDDGLGEGWLLMRSSNNTSDTARSRATSPFSPPQRYDKDGWLPHTPSHLLSDLQTGRCRACVAEYLTSSRLQFYVQVRLSDVAVLRGMPVEFTKWTWRAGVPFRQLLPVLVENDEEEWRAEDARVVVRAARGPLAEEYYQMMEPPWWNNHNELPCVLKLGYED